MNQYAVLNYELSEWLRIEYALYHTQQLESTFAKG